MKGGQARTLTKDAIEKLAKALEAGKSDALTAFLATAARFHRYSFRNVMLIATQADAGDEAEGGIRFKAAYVFDVSQTEGDALPEFAKVSGDPANTWGGSRSPSSALYLVDHQAGEEAPYERLWTDAMAGDGALFAREDAVETARVVVDRVLTTHRRVRPYKPASWGPRRPTRSSPRTAAGATQGSTKKPRDVNRKRTWGRTIRVEARA